MIPPRASATPAESSDSAQPTESPALEPDSTISGFLARLNVLNSRAKVFTGDETETEVRPAQSANIQVEDGIEVLPLEGQNEQSYSILSFPDFLNVELFGATKVFLADVKQGAGGSNEVTLDLDGGHMFLHLNDQTLTRVTVQTSYTSIKTLTAGAEFDVCRSGALTCVMVKRGVVEINAEGRREIVRAGEAGYVLQGQVPSAAICASLPAFIAWEGRFRQFANVPPLQDEIYALAQKPCPLTPDGFPLDARILYQDEFRRPSSGWEQGETDSFTARYVRDAGPRYYEVQVQGPEDQYLAFVPEDHDYEDVNVDVRASAEAGSDGDFRYGIVIRRSGDDYYAFAISPPTKTWYFLKSSANGLEILKDGIDKRMRALEAQDTLRVETYGSAFLVFINGRYIDWISDPDYASGQIGLFVETIDNSDALINFNSITIWDIPGPELAPNRGENCFNAGDDDGDGWIDQSDPDCQRPELILTSPPASPAVQTNTPGPAGTPTGPPPTQPPLPTLPLPTDVPPTAIPPLPTLPLPLPTIDLPLPIAPPVGTPGPH